jgi:RNAse (barnase) inhibitor barstar
MRFSVYINTGDGDRFALEHNLHFTFTSNFPFCERYSKDLDNLTKKIANDLLFEPVDAKIIYTHTLEVLADYLNPYNVGIVLDNSVEKMIKKVEEKQALLRDYSKVYSQLMKSDYYQDPPSFEEWLKWQEEFTED